MFAIGQRVVCVDADGAPELRRGAVYSIRSLCRYHGPSGVHLNEVEPVGRYSSFKAERFRLATERGMAELRRILADHRQPELIGG